LFNLILLFAKSLVHDFDVVDGGGGLCVELMCWHIVVRVFFVVVVVGWVGIETLEMKTMNDE